MKGASLVCLLALCSVSLAYKNPDWYQDNEGQMDSTTGFAFKVALRQQNLDYLDDLFWKVSDPKGPFYGNYLTNEQISEIVRLPEERIVAVENYFKSQQTEHCAVTVTRSIHQDFLYVHSCVGHAHNLFSNLSLKSYSHKKTPEKILRADQLMDAAENKYFLGVPGELHEDIFSIMDVTDLPVKMTRSGLDPSLPWSKDAKELTPSEIITNYGVSTSFEATASVSASSGQTGQAVIEFDNALFETSDLSTFQSTYSLPSNPIKKVVGTQSPFGLNAEASLDVQYVTAISGTLETWDFVFSATASFVDVVETIMGTTDAPKNISCSWGSLEDDNTSSTMTQTSNEFMKMGVAGFTFLIASGDSGPGVGGSSCGTYTPQFPATSPYVTSVGGTFLNEKTNVETAWRHSSGGFSNFFDRPSFQTSAVATYLKNATLPANPSGRYTTTGRAFPDVSAYGAWYPIYNGGSEEGIGGTSGATPIFTAIIALINVDRYNAGLAPLGNINQALYSLTNGVGVDIVTGETISTDRSGTCSGSLPGFTAIAGWDPATGLGRPDYKTLLSQLSGSSDNTKLEKFLF